MWRAAEWHMKDQNIPFEGVALEDIIPVLSERAKTLKELAAQSRYFYQEFTTYERQRQKLPAGSYCIA